MTVTASWREARWSRLAGWVAGGFLAACGGGGEGFVTPAPPPPPVVITIAPTTATVNVGATTLLAVSIAGGAPTPTLQSCASSSPSVATVATTAGGCTVTGVAPGTTTITASTSAGQNATASVTVAALPPALTGFTLTPATATLPAGLTVPLVATATNPAGTTVSITYASSATAVATVSAAGTITAVAPGTAVITATAVGVGAGFAPTTLARTATITVTADPCAPTVVTVPFTRTGTVTASSCLITTNVQRRGDVFRTTFAAASAVELRFLPTGFTPYASVFSLNEGDFIFDSRATVTELRRIWHVPAGPAELRIGALAAGQTGTYSLQATAVSASVENCNAVIIGGTVSSGQSITNTDCRYGDRFADEYIVFSSRPCVITMTRTVGAGGLADPVLEVYVNNALVSSDDDGGGGVNARISLPSCRSTTNGVLLVRATSFDAFDGGSYTFSIAFGPASTVTAAAEPFPIPSVILKGPRATRGLEPAAVAGGDWLRHLGVGTPLQTR